MLKDVDLMKKEEHIFELKYDILEGRENIFTQTSHKI